MFSGQSIHAFREISSRAEWARAIARAIAGDIHRGLAADKNVAIVVPGGNTPAPIFAELAKSGVDWSRVCVVASDERWVAPDHPDSNQGSIERNLIGKGAGARIQSLWRNAARPSDALEKIEHALATMPRPFSAVLIGMGEDGHFASLFPGALETPVALAPTNTKSCIAIDRPQNGHPRMSLTLSALIDTARTRLAVTGKAKRDVLNRAAKGINPAFPISAMLAQDKTPVEVFWAP